MLIVTSKKIDLERGREMNEEPLLLYILHFKGLCRFEYIASIEEFFLENIMWHCV